MELQPGILGSQNAMNAVDGATIERRIRINRPDEGSARCKGSRAWDPRKDFSQCMQQRKILASSIVYVTSVEMFQAVNEVYRRYFPKDPPARIFVNVPAWNGGFDIEVDCIAAV